MYILRQSTIIIISYIIITKQCELPDNVYLYIIKKSSNIPKKLG